jgi:hypothetical protein
MNQDTWLPEQPAFYGQPLIGLVNGSPIVAAEPAESELTRIARLTPQERKIYMKRRIFDLRYG